MDFSLSPILIAAIIANVGFVQGLKGKMPKISSTISSIIGGCIGAFGVANMSGLAVLVAIQSFVLNWFIVTCGAWLCFESIVKRFTIAKDQGNDKQP